MPPEVVYRMTLLATPYQFESFTRQPPGPRPQQPRVTLYRTGTFGLNQAAYAQLGEPRAVCFLYDRAARAIAIQPVRDPHPDAYRVTQRVSSRSYTIRARRFLCHYAIPFDRPLAWAYVRQCGELLVLHLAEATTLLPTRPH